MRGFLGFLTLVALLIFGMGLITHASGTTSVINSTSNGLVRLFGLELGTVPKSTKG